MTVASMAASLMSLDFIWTFGGVQTYYLSGLLRHMVLRVPWGVLTSQSSKKSEAMEKLKAQRYDWLDLCFWRSIFSFLSFFRCIVFKKNGCVLSCRHVSVSGWSLQRAVDTFSWSYKWLWALWCGCWELNSSLGRAACALNHWAHFSTLFRLFEPRLNKKTLPGPVV